MTQKLSTKFEELDIKGLCCPQVLINVKKKIDTLNENTTLKVLTTDPLAHLDIKAYTHIVNNVEFISYEKKEEHDEIVLNYGTRR